MKFSKERGFTLIEMLVVIGIIAVLLGTLTTYYTSAQKKARDAQRRSDIKQISTALESYRQDTSNSQYPAALPACDSALTNTGATVTYMKKTPCDPKDATPTTKYGYSPDNTNITFALCACLENPTVSDGACTSCSGYTCASSKCAVVTGP